MLVEGQVYDDLLCVKYEGKNSHYQNLYTMQCTVCGRTKVCKDYVVLRHTGTLHKACGKGLKTEDSKFYSIWQSMRTRTTNPNYWAAEHYSEKGINNILLIFMIKCMSLIAKLRNCMAIMYL